MSRRASRASSASLRGIDLAAVQANLRALGHDVDEGQLVDMLRSIDIGEVLARSSRGTPSSTQRQQAQPSPGPSASTAADARSGSQLSREDMNASQGICADKSSDTAQASDYTQLSSSMQRSMSRSRCLSNISADSRSISSLEDAAGHGAQRLSSLSTSRRSTISGATASAPLSDVPEDDSASSRSWYCDPAYSSSLASRRAWRNGRASRRSSGSGGIDAMSMLSDAGSGRRSASVVTVAVAPYPGNLYQALPCKMPQTDRLARWREYKEVWESDPFLTAGGDCKVSKRPKENFGEFFAREHALLALEREAYIKGRGSLFVVDDDQYYL